MSAIKTIVATGASNRIVASATRTLSACGSRVVVGRGTDLNDLALDAELGRRLIDASARIKA